MENRSVALREDARAHGLCDMWYGRWKDNESATGLLTKFVEGIDFCIAKDWPKIDVIKEFFTVSELRSGGVYLDESDILVEGAKRPVLMGDTTARLEYSCFNVADVYVRHSCDVSVVVSGYARVAVNVYDMARVFVQGDCRYPVRVYAHGKCRVDYDGNVIIKREK